MKKVFCIAMAALLIACCNAISLANTIIDSPAVVSKAAEPIIISFSGYKWVVKAPANAVGPGPNLWNPANVYVDNEGSLHLKLAKNASTGKWECAEVASVDSFGDGTYQWQVEGPLATLDKNIVLGLFNYSGKDGFDEMDIEFARWGDAANPPLNYTIWPAAAGQNKSYYNANFSMPNGTYTTHRFKRTAKSITLKSLYGFTEDDTNLFESKTFKAPAASISIAPMPILMNLWLYNGLEPSNGQGMEIVIHSFKYIPL